MCSKTNMADSEYVNPVYFGISNIPVSFHSADLRNYFSQFIESAGFRCFHYRHRPEILRESYVPENTGCVSVSGEAGGSSPSETDQRPADGSVRKRTVKTCCCVVSVQEKEADRFARMYARKHWVNSKGNWLAKRCVIKRVKVSSIRGQC